ncbi:MAG: FAD binding domain-containing protein [Terriglobales bacterium]
MLPALQLHRPRELAPALELLAAHGSEAKLLAGGTDLIPSLKQGLFSPAHLVDLSAIPALAGVVQEANGDWLLGAMTRIHALAEHPGLGQAFPLLAAASGQIASPVLRHMGTLGGNLCLDTRCLWYNQSYLWRQSCGFCLKKDGTVCHVAPGGHRCWAAFSADTAPALLALDASVEIAAADGRRWLPLAGLYSGAGDRPLRLGPNEILTRLRLPAASAGMRGSYQKFRLRSSIDYPMAALALALRRQPDGSIAARLAITALNPAPVLVPGVAACLAADPPDLDAVARLVNQAAKPLSTSTLPSDYRREMVQVQTRRALAACLALA